MKSDPLGDKVKALEDVANEHAFEPNAFLIARVDGRAFHTFTRGMAKPADLWLLDSMVHATVETAADFKSRLAYVQSDEATFCWHYETPAHGSLPFNGRVQKLCSLIAGVFSACFIDGLVARDPKRYLELGRVPAFDCRIWAVPGAAEQAEAFAWREKDAVKNAVSMAACTVASPSELAGMKHRERLALLEERGFDWEGLPLAFRAGAYVRRQSRMGEIDAETLAKIPPAKRPAAGSLFLRHETAIDPKLQSIHQVYNALEFFTHGVDPLIQ
jgi:tRNA(His) 5'-end guanylyltransferase